MSARSPRWLCIAAAALASAASASEPIWLGRFTRGLEGWTAARTSREEPAPSFRARSWDGVAAVEVLADRSMVMLTRPLGDDFDLLLTPILCWRWRVDAPLERADWGTRAGDDFAARVYVGVRTPEEAMSFVLRARLRIARAVWGEVLPDAAVNYVWDNRHPVGAQRANAYADRTQMIVVENGAAQARRWVEERVDAGRDVAALFGRDARPTVLAIASDTDDTGESARAGFADLHFVARSQKCAFPQVTRR